MSSIFSNLAEQTTVHVVPVVSDGGVSAKLSVIPGTLRSVGLSSRRVAVLLALGVLSGALYLLLFAFADELGWLSAQARAGEKLYALIPIAIALVFSLVHGAFTSRFWDLLGLKARTR